MAEPGSRVKVKVTSCLAVLRSGCHLIRALWRGSGVIYHPSPAKLGLVLQLLCRSFSNASPAAALAWQSREMQDELPSQRPLLQQFPVPGAVPELPPRQARAGLFIVQTASPRDTGNGRVYYKRSGGTDYCWRRSRVIKDWSGEGEEEGTGHNLCLCVRGCRLLVSARHSPNPQDLCLVLVGFCAVHPVLCQSPLTFYCINHPLYAAPRLGERLQVLF